jgi:hypothetical protein
LLEDLIGSFGKLQESSERQYAGKDPAQNAMIVQALHYGPTKVSFGVIARMFGKLKGAVYKEYERGQGTFHRFGKVSSDLPGRGTTCYTSLSMLQNCHWDPIERGRIEVDFSEIEKFYRGLQSEGAAVPSAMVFNLDGTGHQDWPDRTDIRVLVPVSYDGSLIHVPCDRSSKQALLLVCIAADGTFVQRIVIILHHTLE